MSQQAERAQRELEKVKFESEQAVVKARAEAEGLRAQREQITDMLLRLRMVENERAAIAKWNGSLRTRVRGVKKGSIREGTSKRSAAPFRTCGYGVDILTLLAEEIRFGMKAGY